jgi:hypothetical protein
VEVNGAVQAGERLRMLGSRAFNTLPIMETMAEFLFESQRARVQTEPWAPLKDVTVARKLSQDEDPGILKDEWRPIKGKPTRVGNKLYLALTLDGATGQVKRATRTTATFGVKSAGKQELFYARFVQNVKGTKRRILALSEADALAVTEGIGSWIVAGEGAGQSGYIRGSFGFKGSPTRGA